jgi:type II secretory pathway pseudopilin PulG
MRKCHVKKQWGFTLIELVLFITLTAILASTTLLSLRNLLAQIPNNHMAYIALQAARGCLDGMVAEKNMFGISFFSCPSTTVPGNCVAPTGYTVGVNVACTTVNSDVTYKTFTVTITGLGNATLTALVAAI